MIMTVAIDRFACSNVQTTIRTLGAFSVLKFQFHVHLAFYLFIYLFMERDLDSATENLSATLHLLNHRVRQFACRDV